MEVSSSAVGPFCCVAAVCPPCSLYTDVADRSFRQRHHLLHALEQGEGCCAVRQYVRKAGGVPRQQNAHKPKASQQQRQTHQETLGAQQHTQGQQHTQAQQPQQQQRWCKEQEITRSNKSTPERLCRWRDEGIETRLRKADEDEKVSACKVSELCASSCRNTPACPNHNIDNKREAAEEAHEACDVSLLRPCTATVSEARVPFTRAPVTAGTAIPASDYRSPLLGECNTTNAKASACGCNTFLRSSTATCETSASAPVTEVSRRCTRWKVLQLAWGADRDQEKMTEKNTGKGGEDSVSECQEAVPRPPDVLLACTDYLLRFLLPAVIYPFSLDEQNRNNVPAGSRAAATDHHGRCAGARLSSSASVNTANAAVGANDTASFAADAHPNAGLSGRTTVAAAVSSPSSASASHDKGRREITTVEGLSRAELAPSDLVCSCLCHRSTILHGPDSKYTVKCADFNSEAAVSSSDVAGSTIDAGVVAATDHLCGNNAAPTATVPAADAVVFDVGAAGNGVYSFFADRLRALRQEAVAQQLLDRPLYFLLLLQSARFHLFADIYWGGGLFNSKADNSTDVADGIETAVTLLKCLKQPQLLHRPASTPHQSPNAASNRAIGRAGTAHPARNAGFSNTRSTSPMSSAHAPAAAAATLLQTVGFSASLNRFLLTSCMQQLLNFVISKARPFFCRRQRAHQHRRLRRQRHLKGSSVGGPASTAEARKITDISTETSTAVCNDKDNRRVYSAGFYDFASLLHVHPQIVDEVVACALLYLLLPREDTPAHHQAVQLLLQQTASAFRSFWRECHWTRYAGRLVLLAAAGRMHQCLRELLLLSTGENRPFLFFLQCSSYFHLDFLRAAIAANIKAAAPLSSPGTRLPLNRLLQLLHCDSPAAAVRLAHATGGTIQQQQPTTHSSQDHPLMPGKPTRGGLPQQQEHERETVTRTIPSAASVNVYFCRGSRSSGEGGQSQAMRVLHGGRSESAATSGDQSCKANSDFFGYSFSWLQSDAWQPSPPPNVFSFPRSRAEVRKLFNWPVHCTTLEATL